MSKRLLLVEDEAIIALSEARLLRSHGYEVATASSGEEAIAAVDSDPDISLVLMDIDLGAGIDGTDAAEDILERHDVPIVFLSSHTEPEVVEKTEGITSYGYILKNSGEAVLLASIRMAFRLHEAQCERIERERIETSLRESEDKFRTLMGQTIDMLVVHDLNGRIVDVNEQGERYTGYSRQELLSMSIADLDPDYHEREDGGRFWDEIAFDQPHRFEARLQRKDGSIFVAEIVLSKIAVGGETYIMTLSRDISERKAREERITESERRLRITLNSIGDAVIAADRQARVVRMNPVAERLCGWTQEEAYGKPLREVFHIVNANTRARVEDPVGVVMHTGEVSGLANHTMLISRDGAEYQIADSASPIRTEDGEIDGAVLVFRDVTEQYEKDRQLRESAERLERFLHYSPFLISEMDPEGRYLRVNPALANVLGLSPPQVAGKRFEEILPQHLVDVFRRRLGRVRETAQPLHVEDELDAGDGARPYVTTLFPLLDPEGNVNSIGAIAEDITERRQAETAVRRERAFLSSVLDTIDDAIIICDADGRIVRFNEAARRLHGLPEQYIPSDRWADYYDLYRVDLSTPLPTDEIPLFRAFEGEHVRNAEIAVAPKGRPSRLLRCNGNQLKDETGRRAGAVVVMHDVTDYRQVEENLREALRSKDSVMRELNHRVKNNLSMLSSLISLKDADTEEDLSDIKHRIAAIGLVHEKLHRQDAPQQISAREYLQELLDAVFSSFTDQPVHIDTAIDDIHIDHNTAIPLGLIVNEVATNAIKHGFRSNEEARFTVTFSQHEGNTEHTLTLANTGNPFPEDVGLDHEGTLGLQLITGLTTQLGGTIDLQKRPYPVFTIQIPEGISREE
ncbi:MAG: PAS domain S-box protein [Spirochaetes bacterium]|jgi:PAS domain S-box-containing protein|nr:PAS domain S-box protein [Spirochaetota bacterium]